MTATATQARDEILDLFKASWEADVSSQDVLVQYENVGPQQPPKTATAGDAPSWARIQVRHTTGEQATLAGESGSRIFRRFGIITVQVFTPVGDGLATHDVLTSIARDAFEGKSTSPGNVWLRNARVSAIGEDGPWYQSNVIVDFEYDQLK